MVRWSQGLARGRDLCYASACKIPLFSQEWLRAMRDVSMMSLKRKLEQERALVPLVAQVWGVSPGQNDASTIALIMQQMQNAHAARSVWEVLSAPERLCLFHLVGSGNPVEPQGLTLSSLCQSTELPTACVEEVAESLRARWYLVDVGTLSPPSKKGRRSAGSPSEPVIFPFRECLEQLWRTGLEIFRPEADRSNFELLDLLSTMPTQQLSQLASKCHVGAHSSYGFYAVPVLSARELQQRVAQALCHPLMAFELLHMLSPSAQEIFLWLCCQRGKVKASEVRVHLGPGDFNAVISTLEAHALAFDTLTSDGTRWLFIPSDLLTQVSHEAELWAEDDQRYALRPLGENAAAEHASQHPIVLYDLATVVGMSYQMVIEPTKENRLPKRLRVKIRPLLHGRTRTDEAGEDVYVDQVFQTAKALGLLCCVQPADEEKRRYQPGAKLPEWSELTLVGQAQQFLHWWKETGTSWMDVRPNGRVLSSSSITHQQITGQLKRCVPGQWYHLDALLYAIWRQVPLGLYDYSQHALIKPIPLRTKREEWVQREAMTSVGHLTGTLSELGIVSLGSTKETAESYDLFCVTAFGAAVLAEADAQSETQAPQLIVQPNYEVLLMEFCPQLVYRLLPVAQVLRMGVVSTFRLTEATLFTGLASGVKLADLLFFLEEHSAPKELPQNVVYTIKDWAKAYREFQLSEVIMIETPEAETEENLRRVLGNLAVDLRHVAPGIFLVISQGASFGDLRKRLRLAGIVVRGEPSKSKRK
ncbi:MAG: hypothetical protein E6J34_09405 [Chloroflexi bacterium]|nr:MAG: hypothetical protein E6J34_09405 [Chloroflexota bacterium]